MDHSGLNLRLLLALFSGVVMLATLVMIPAALFSDKNEVWARRLCVVGVVAGAVFLLAWFL